MLQLVVNADDFGFDPAINAAVAQAHEGGILTSASLMVAGPCAEAAVAYAKAHPTLSVGLHLTLVEGTTVLPPSQLRPLTDARGALPSGFAAFGVRLTAGGRPAARALEAEARAQIHWLLDRGLQPTHLDSHMHTHLHPRALEIVARLAVEYGIPFVRAPLEQWSPPETCWQAPALLARWLIFQALGRRARRILRQRGLRTADLAIGVLTPGRMTEAFVAGRLACLPAGLTEIFFHPAAVADLPHMCGRAGYQHLAELQALRSPHLRRVMAERGIQLVGFRELADNAVRAVNNAG